MSDHLDSEKPLTLEYAQSMASRELTLIVAATNKMGIGRASTLPWTGLKQEMAYFKKVTTKSEPGSINAVIMGRKTWESIPTKFRPLKDRLNITVTSASSLGQGSFSVPSLEAAIQCVGSTVFERKAFVIGGAQLYGEALTRAEAKRILFTRIHTDFECDTFFPIELKEDGTADGWERKSKEELDAWAGEIVPTGVQEENGTKYEFEMWERKAASFAT